MRRFVRLGTIDGVAVSAHWSTLALALLALALAPTPLGLTLVALAAYAALLLLHEWGHVLAARGRRCEAYSIELYACCGVTRYELPPSRFDQALIAWGGVAAQLAVAAPLMYVTMRSGLQGPELLNAAVVILGPLSLLFVVFNLVPVAPLDGALAWRIVPALYWQFVGRRRASALWGSRR